MIKLKAELSWVMFGVLSRNVTLSNGLMSAEIVFPSIFPADKFFIFF